MRYRRVTQRPEQFVLAAGHPLGHRCVFAGLGQATRTTQYRDTSSYGNHGTLTGYTGAGNTPAEMWRWIPQLGRWGLKGNGTTDRVVTGTIAHGIGTGDLTFSCWAMTTDVTKAYTALAGNGVYAPGFFLCTGGRLAPIVYAGGYKDFGTSWVTIANNTWYHVAFVRRAGVGYCYVNGVVSPTTPAWTNSMADAAWGILDDSPSLDAPSMATIADVMLYKLARSAADIREEAAPSNVMLSGLISPVVARNRIFVPSGEEPPTSSRRRRLLCGAST